MILYQIKLTWFLLLSFLITQTIFALPVLTIEDEIVMSQLVRNSNSIDELRLCLKLFPETPFQATFKKRLFKLEMSRMSHAERQKYAELEKHELDLNIDRRLTVNDDLAMSRMLENSRDPKALRLFIKLFPNSNFRPVFENRLNNIEKPQRSAVVGEVAVITEEETDAFQEVEEEIATASAEKKESEDQLKEETQQKADESKETTTNEAAEKEEAPKEEPEVDWAKYELGYPLAINFENTGDTADGAPLGIYAGWSSEFMFDTGFGGGMYYFSQKFKSSGATLQHLYFEGNIKGLVIKQINWGIGWGAGITNIDWPDKPGGMKIIPSYGFIQSISVGYKYQSFGINYIMASFTGEYRWTLEDGVNSTKGKEDWKGTLSMLSFEYHY